MTRVKLHSIRLALAAFLHVWAITGVNAAPVHVEVDTGRTQEHGAGISVGKGPECFVVVPFHVVEFARTITITDGKGRSAGARKFQAPDGIDAALLIVDDGHSLDCPEDWDDGSAGENAMHDAEFLVSKKVKQRGFERRRFFLSSESSLDVSLRPYTSDTADQLQEGDSGSAVYAKNSLVGMIYDVNTATGVGRAIKQSKLHAQFGGIVLERGAKRALIVPVYKRNTENKYATIAVRDFVDSRTSFEVVELHPSVAAQNLKDSRKGLAPEYPDDIDYVIAGTIIKESGRRESNPNYKASAASESNFGKQLLNSLGNRGVRYIYVSNIDVEVQILIPEEDRQLRHIERLEYKVPLTDKVDQRKLKSDLPVQAVTDAVQATMFKYGLPVSADQKEEPNATLGDLLGLGKKD